MTTIKIIAMACDKTRTEVVQKELVASTTQDNSTSLNPQKTSWFVKRAQVKQLCLWVMWFISTLKRICCGLRAQVKQQNVVFVGDVIYITLKRICCGLHAQVKQQNVVFVGDVIYIDLETHLLWLRAQVKKHNVVFVGDVIYIGLETHLLWFEWERRELTSPAPEAATSWTLNAMHNNSKNAMFRFKSIIVIF